jgi:hypothetical protein
MNSEEFLQLLCRDGFPEPVEVQQAPKGRLGIHEHPFEVKALIVEGEVRTTGPGKFSIWN